MAYPCSRLSITSHIGFLCLNMVYSCDSIALSGPWPAFQRHVRQLPHAEQQSWCPSIFTTTPKKISSFALKSSKNMSEWRLICYSSDAGWDRALAWKELTIIKSIAARMLHASCTKSIVCLILSSTAHLINYLSFQTYSAKMMDEYKMLCPG